VRQVVGRALQFASSDVKGPVFIVGGRDVLAAEMNNEAGFKMDKWAPVGPAALREDAVMMIVEALVAAERPLLITGYSGRNHLNPAELVMLADAIPGLRVHDTAGSNSCFPFSHAASFYCSDKCTTDADDIVILDCDVPWIPARNKATKQLRQELTRNTEIVERRAT
jgi:thiamine pyrophosphate-dependent acetolactate synthase large subunit-like protein